MQQGLYFDELTIGQSAEATHVVGAADIEGFAAVSGDVNPVHLDAVIGNQLPGPGSIYLSQSLRFRRPVKIGDAVTARVTVKSLDAEKSHVVFDTACIVNGKTVLDGEALILAPRRNA